MTDNKMKVVKIKLESDIFLWNKAIKIYENSFPLWEKEPIAEIYKKIKEEKQIMYVLMEDESPIAVVILDISKTKRYILFAYLAVRTDRRLSGFGHQLCSEVIRVFKEDTESKYLFLEAEKDLYYFYEKVGFKKLNINYLSPSFVKKDESIPMGFFGTEESENLSEEELKEIIEDIYINSYNLEKSDERFQSIKKM